MRMKAAVLEELGAPLAVQRVELADPRAGEALVRLVACGVCHIRCRPPRLAASRLNPAGVVRWSLEGALARLSDH